MRAPGSTRTSQAVSAVSWFGGKGGFKAIIYSGNASALLRSSEGCQSLPAPKALSARHPAPHPRGPGGRDRDADRGWNVPPHPPPRLPHGKGTPPGSRARPAAAAPTGRLWWALPLSPQRLRVASWEQHQAEREGAASSGLDGLRCPQLRWQGTHGSPRCDWPCPPPRTPALRHGNLRACVCCDLFP